MLQLTLNHKIDALNGFLMSKICKKRGITLVSTLNDRKVIFCHLPMAAILDLCKLQNLPKVATPATKLNILHGPIQVWNHLKTIHFSWQQGPWIGNWTISLMPHSMIFDFSVTCSTSQVVLIFYITLLYYFSTFLLHSHSVDTVFKDWIKNLDNRLSLPTLAAQATPDIPTSKCTRGHEPQDS